MNLTLTPAATKFIACLLRFDRLLLDGVAIDFANTPLQTRFVSRDPTQVACGQTPASLPTLAVATTD